MGLQLSIQVFKAPGPTFIPCTVAKMIRQPYSHTQNAMAREEVQAQPPADEGLGQSDMVTMITFCVWSPWVILNYYQLHLEKHEIMYPTNGMCFQRKTLYIETVLITIFV